MILVNYLKNWHGICIKKLGLRYQIYSLFDEKTLQQGVFSFFLCSVSFPYGLLQRFPVFSLLKTECFILFSSCPVPDAGQVARIVLSAESIAKNGTGHEMLYGESRCRRDIPMDSNGRKEKADRVIRDGTTRVDVPFSSGIAVSLRPN